MKNTKNIRSVIIIGSGPAGYTAAIYAARANLKPLLIAGYISGGQLMQTTEVENYPGFPEGIQGPDLMNNMRKQAERFGTEIVEKDVTEVDFSSNIKRIYIGEEEFLANSVIIASGAVAKWLEIPSEQKYRGRGVSSCATCDGAFFNNKIVGVVGGGDTAMEEAIFLTRFASKVYIIHRRDRFRASKIMQDKVMNHPKITILFNSEVVDMSGDPNLEKVLIRNTYSNEETQELAIQGLFIAIGHTPMTSFLGDTLPKKANGYLELGLHAGSKFTTQSSIEGVFIAGDVHDDIYRQAITAAGEGCKAAIDAERYLELLEKN